MNKIARENNLDITAQSAGIFAEEGSGATREAIDAAKLFDTDISSHKARCLDSDMLAKSDLILTMTESHKELLFPVASEKIHTLNEYAGLEGDISDPFGGDSDEYIETANQILRAVNIIAEGLKK